MHKLELNPYWKDGGTGLPPEEMAGFSQKKGREHFIETFYCPINNFFHLSNVPCEGHMTTSVMRYNNLRFMILTTTAS